MKARHGIALLLVLGTLVIVTSALGLLTLASGQSHRAASIATRERQISDLLRSAEPLVQEWLGSQSARAVVGPDAVEPKVVVAEIAWQKHGRETSLRIAAWDLHGMVPSETSSSSPLWLAVGDEFRDRDYEGVSTLMDLPDSPAHPSVTESTTAIGSQIAVKPMRTRRSASSLAININTAPRPLLEAALRLAQRGDIATIIEARAQGRPSPAPPPGERQQKALVRLAGRSTLWAVRVDAETHGVARSWWTVYESRHGTWEIIERHAIGE